MELALIFGIAMVLALRASMVGASGDGSSEGGERTSGDEDDHRSARDQIAHGTFEVYTLNPDCSDNTTISKVWVHSERDTNNPNAPYVEYWLMPSDTVVHDVSETILKFQRIARFHPPANGTLQEVRTAFVTHTNAAGAPVLHVHHVAKVT